MLARQVKEPVTKGSINFICKNQYRNSDFQSADNLSFETLSLGATMVGPTV